MFDNSCQSSYLLIGKHSETIKRHATGVFQHTKTASNDGQVFLNICTAHLLLLSLSFCTPTRFLDQKEHVSYALWKICEGDVAIAWRQRAMEAMVAPSPLPLLSFLRVGC